MVADVDRPRLRLVQIVEPKSASTGAWKQSKSQACQMDLERRHKHRSSSAFKSSISPPWKCPAATTRDAQR